MLSCCVKPKVAPAENKLPRTSSGIMIAASASQAKGTGEANNNALSEEVEEAKAASTEPTSRDGLYAEKTPPVVSHSLEAAQPAQNSISEKEMSFVESPAPRVRALSQSARAAQAPKITSRALNPPITAATMSAWAVLCQPP